MKPQILAIFIFCHLTIFIAADAAVPKVECYIDLPKTFHDNEALEHIKNCIALEAKYDINYKYFLVNQDNGGAAEERLLEYCRLPAQEPLFEANSGHFRENEGHCYRDQIEARAPT